MKVELSKVNAVKSGSTTVNKIMHGSNRIWPIFPIKMLRDGVYYDVTGIVNDEYVKTVIPNEVCTLVKTKSAWYTGVQLRDNMIFDCWFTSYNSCGGACIGNIGNPSGSAGTGRQLRFINVTDTNDTFYLDYMSSSSSGTQDNRIYKAIKSGTNGSNVDIRLDLQEITYHLNGGAKFFNNESRPRTFFEITNDNGYYLYQQSSGMRYGANSVRPSTIEVLINGWNLSNLVFFTFYKLTVKNEDNELVGNFTWKKVNGDWILYNFDTPCQKVSGRDNGETAYENKTISFPPIIEDYYELSGYFTENGRYYDRLVNVKTGNILKGAEYAKTVTFSQEPDDSGYDDIIGADYATYQEVSEVLTMTSKGRDTFSFIIQAQEPLEVTVNNTPLESIGEFYGEYGGYLITLDNINVEGEDIEISSEFPINILYNFTTV